MARIRKLVSHCGNVNCVNWHTHYGKSNAEVSQDNSRRVTLWLNNSTIGHYLKVRVSCRYICIPMLVYSIIRGWDMGRAWASVDWRICNKLLLTFRNEIRPFVWTWMGVEGTMLNKVIQIQYSEHCRILLICEIKQQQEQGKAKVSSRVVVICAW